MNPEKMKSSGDRCFHQAFKIVLFLTQFSLICIHRPIFKSVSS